MRIVVTDCDHASTDIEHQVVADAGGELVLNQTTAEADVVAGAEGADALLVQYATITRGVLEALPQVRVVSRYGVGVDTVDVAAATELGVAVCNVPDYGTEAVSDHAIALVVATVRGLGALDRGVRAGRHDLASSSALPIRQFSSQVVGVLGSGRIGAATARKAAALGFRVLVHDARLEAGSTHPEGWPVVAFEQLLAESDVVSVHTPLDAASHHLLDAAAFATMKRGAILVNTSRGGVVDTAAMVAALESGHRDPDSPHGVLQRGVLHRAEAAHGAERRRRAPRPATRRPQPRGAGGGPLPGVSPAGVSAGLPRPRCR